MFVVEVYAGDDNESGDQVNSTLIFVD